jgi:adenosylhomocysteine nucleosidase
MISIIFATLAEAGPFLELSGAIQLDDKPFRVFQVPTHPTLLVNICGMGKVAAALACQVQILQFNVDEIVNAGACGALRSGPGYLPGAVYCIATAVEGDHEILGEAPRPIISDGKIDWDQRAARLVTCDRPVFDAARRLKLSSVADLVDMEGAAIARVAAMYQIPWTMLKGISDAADHADRATLKENLPMVSEKIGTILWERMKLMQGW